MRTAHGLAAESIGSSCKLSQKQYLSQGENLNQKVNGVKPRGKKQCLVGG